jgi:hypothetical protein
VNSSQTIHGVLLIINKRGELAAFPPSQQQVLVGTVRIALASCKQLGFEQVCFGEALSTQWHLSSDRLKSSPMCTLSAAHDPVYPQMPTCSRHTMHTRLQDPLPAGSAWHQSSE